VMLQHHGGRPSCRDHEHKALKTRYMSPDGLSGPTGRHRGRVSTLSTAPSNRTASPTTASMIPLRIPPAPARRESGSKRSVPLRKRHEIQKMLPELKARVGEIPSAWPPSMRGKTLPLANEPAGMSPEHRVRNQWRRYRKSAAATFMGAAAGICGHCPWKR
jgi:hypothetical protein